MDGTDGWGVESVSSLCRLDGTDGRRIGIVLGRQFYAPVTTVLCAIADDVRSPELFEKFRH